MADLATGGWPHPLRRRGTPPVVLALLILLSAAVAGGVVIGQWLGTLLVLVGLSFVLAVVIRPMVGLLAWLVSAPILNYYVQIPLPAGVPDLTFGRLIVGFLLALIIGPVILGRARFPHLGRTEKAMLVFGGIASFCCLFGDNPFTSNLQLLLKGYLMPYMLFFAVKHLVKSDADIHMALWVVIPQAVYLSLIGAYQRFTGVMLFIPKTVTLESTYLLEPGRATGPFVNSVEFGTVVAIGVVVSLILLTIRRSDLHAAVLLLAIPIAALGVFYCYTRAVWLSLIIACIGLYFWVPRLRRLIGTGAVLAVIGAVVAVPIMLADPLFVERFTAINPIVSRLLMYPTVFRMAVHHPFFGYGFSSTTFALARSGYFAAFAGMGLSTSHTVGYPHNEFMHILVLTGFLGFSAYLTIYWSVWKSFGRLAALTPEGDPFGRAFLGLVRAVFVLVVVNMFFVDVVFLGYLGTYVFFFFGLAAARLRRLEEEAAAEV